MRHATSALLLFTLTLSAHAAPLPFGETLPTNIRGCVSVGTCAVTGLVYISPTGANLMTAYNLADARSGTLVDKTLVHYALDTTSSRTTQGLDEYGYPLASVTTPITGGIWLELNDQYDLTATLHPLSLHLDQVSAFNPYVWNVPMINGELQLAITSSGLLAGSGGAASECCSPGSTFGTLFAMPGSGPVGPAACLADGCSASVALNLLNLGYLSFGQLAVLTFNDADNRSLLYDTFQSDPWSGGTVREAFAVRPVPVPAAFWLLVSGIAALAGFRGRGYPGNQGARVVESHQRRFSVTLSKIRVRPQLSLI
jgi:hypothetical protein